MNAKRFSSKAELWFQDEKGNWQYIGEVQNMQIDEPPQHTLGFGGTISGQVTAWYEPEPEYLPKPKGNP